MNRSAFLYAACIALTLGGCATENSSAPAPAPRSSTYVVDPPPSYSRNYCADCGTVESVNERQVSGKPNVAGAVVGAIIGGVVGHQFGSGRGNTAATAGGAVAGGAIGSQVNKDEASTVYDMNIRMDDGNMRTITVAAAGTLRSGSRVRITGDHVVPM